MPRFLEKALNCLFHIQAESGMKAAKLAKIVGVAAGSMYGTMIDMGC